jgi:hypothetical protein
VRDAVMIGLDTEKEVAAQLEGRAAKGQGD